MCTMRWLRRGLVCGVLPLWLMAVGLGSGLVAFPTEAVSGNSRLEQLRARAEEEEAQRLKWQKRYREQRKAIDEAQGRVEEANANASWSSRGVTRDTIEAAKAELAASRRKLDALYEEARREGIPPGWLRD